MPGLNSSMMGGALHFDQANVSQEELLRRRREQFFYERFYKDRERGWFSKRAWEAYGRNWHDWGVAASMDVRREATMATNVARQAMNSIFGTSFELAEEGYDRATLESIGFALMAPRVRFLDTRAAQTMRQATLSAMHNSIYSLRGALGNEASLMHR